MADTPPPEVAQPSEPVARRRVTAGEGPAREGRTGCLLTGAVLGVVVGAVFAFYGLPPILKAVYGEKHVAVGASYEGHGKAIRAESLTPSSSVAGWLVVLTVTSQQDWKAGQRDWRLEVDGVDEWIIASDPADTPDGSLALAAGITRTLVLRFAAAGSGRPTALHLADPRVRFDLTGLAEADVR